jgi:hypothetical protein
MRSCKLFFAFCKQKREGKSTFDALILKRREWAKSMENSKEKEKDLQVHWNLHSDIVISLLLYAKHDCYKSHYADAVMNFYGVSFDKVISHFFTNLYS